MARRSLALLIAFAASGCGRTDTPTVYYVEDRWTDEEIVVIRAAADKWNDLAMTQLRYPTPLLEYGGRVHDRFREDVFADDRHVVYRISSAEECPLLLNPEELGGYATMQDVLLFSYNLYGGTNWYPEYLYSVTLHEFGHFIGLPHFENRIGIMNPLVSADDLRPADIDQFCIAYECK